jgi:hypothetical protein
MLILLSCESQKEKEMLELKIIEDKNIKEVFNLTYNKCTRLAPNLEDYFSIEISDNRPNSRFKTLPYLKNVEFEYTQFNKLLNEKEELIENSNFWNQTFYTLPSHCNTREKYISYINQLKVENEANYQKILNSSADRAQEIDRLIKSKLYKPFVESLKGFSNGRTYTYQIIPQIKTNGLAEAKKMIFAGDKYKGGAYMNLLSNMTVIEKDFESIENRSSNTETFILQIDLETILMVGAYGDTKNPYDYPNYYEKKYSNNGRVFFTNRSNQSVEYGRHWNIVILKRQNGIKYYEGQNLDDYAFRIVGTQHYKGLDYPVVEAFK